MKSLAQTNHLMIQVALLAHLFVSAVDAQDSNLQGTASLRNNAVEGADLPVDWEIGDYDRATREYIGGRNIKWSASLGSQTYGTPVISDGRVFIGTNNAGGYVRRYPARVDLGCLLCFRESDGKFLWQHSNEKLLTGRKHDWPQQGVCSTPLVENDRLWYVSNRGEVVCLDTAGFYDDEDDGPNKEECVRLFSVDTMLEMSLDRGRVDSRIRAAFANAGIELPGNLSVGRSRVNNGTWTIREIDKAVSPRAKWISRFEIKREKKKLVAFQLSEGKPTMQMFSIGNTLWPELVETNDMDESLRRLFIERGVELPEQVRITIGKPEKAWSFTVNTDGAKRQFKMSVDDRTLSCFTQITPDDKDEADVVWRFDMMKKLGVLQHNIANCSPASFGDVLFICTSNGVDESHANIPSPDAASFIALNKTTGKLLWTDRSPGANILHGQWASPAIGELGGVPQVIFPGGDGWVYSFRADAWDEKTRKPILIWKFDANPKRSKWILGGRGTRNNIVAFPVIHDGLVYITVGQDPEHGEGNGHLWCIDPTRRGDVSAELAMKEDGKMRTPIPHRRHQAVRKDDGEIALANPNSAVVWHYEKFDQDGDSEIDFHESFHRSITSPVIKGGLLFIMDFSGLVHCLDAKTGRVHWTHDLLAACWSSPLIAGNRVYVGDEDGDVTIFSLSADPTESFMRKPRVNWDGNEYFEDEALREIYMDQSIYSTPIAANNVLYIAHRNTLFAIQNPSRDKQVEE